MKKWSLSVSVGVPALDAEHRALYRGVDELQKAASAGSPQEVLAALVDEIVQEAAGHFAHEERMMKRSDCSSFAWHKRLHDSCARQAKAAAARVRAGEPGAVEDLLAFLHTWLRDHIAVADRIMGAHLRNWELARQDSKIAM